MFLAVSKKIYLLIPCFCLSVFLFSLPVQAVNDPSPDAIAIRVMPNTEHFSPLSWYNRNVNIKGAPQSLLVDGYEAVRDGRTVYVSAANLSDNTDNATIYTNIYIISYNQEAENDTQDIFGQILSYWKFNVELVERTGSGQCLPVSTEPCDVAKGCSGQFADHSCENGVCVKRCLYTSDCPNGQYCDSVKAKLIRDIKRMADLREMKIAFNNYHIKNKKYPDLPSGSYLPDKTTSVWPSWNETLGQKLGYRLPLDPVNRLGSCPANFDPITCWDEKIKNFATNFKTPVLPIGSLALAYEADNKNDRYKLCANFETPFKGLPAENRCDSYAVTPTEEAPLITLGVFRGKSGTPFKDYFTVKGKYAIDWSSLRLTANWGDWAARGWKWDYGENGLKVEKLPNGDEDIRSLSARSVDLSSNKTFEAFDLTIEIADIHGTKGTAKGQIRICNQATCASKNAECGKVADDCGGTLLCGDFQTDFDCVNNKCIKL